jgi:hypothetical protein
LRGQESVLATLLLMSDGVHPCQRGRTFHLRTRHRCPLPWRGASPTTAQPTTSIRRVQDEGLRSYLNIFSVRTGELLRRETVPHAWITTCSSRRMIPRKFL